MDDLLNAIGDRLRAGSTTVELLVPFERGDVLAQVHRLGEVVSEQPGEGGIEVRARLDAEGLSRLKAFVLDPPASDDVDAGEPTRGCMTEGFRPPPYPYDRLDELKAVADAHPGGVVDLSIGTPTDPPPPRWS